MIRYAKQPGNRLIATHVQLAMRNPEDFDGQTSKDVKVVYSDHRGIAATFAKPTTDPDLPPITLPPLSILCQRSTDAITQGRLAAQQRQHTHTLFTLGLFVFFMLHYTGLYALWLPSHFIAIIIALFLIHIYTIIPHEIHVLSHYEAELKYLLSQQE